MAIKSFDTLDGIILGEVSGATALDYIPDALGSVVATVDQTKAVTSTARYKPYGDLLSSSGTQPDMGWVGTLGYNQGLGAKHARTYVRARMYDPEEARWITVDPLWPRWEMAYGYAGADPVGLSDPSGMQTVLLCMLDCEVNPCGAAKLGPNEIGAIVCCKGKATICVGLDQSGPSPLPVKRKCVRVHEQEHQKQAENTQMCKGKPDGKLKLPSVDAACSECSAYYAELVCLLDNAKSACPPGSSSGCLNEYDRWLKTRCRLLNEKCGTCDTSGPDPRIRRLCRGVR